MKAYKGFDENLKCRDYQYGTEENYLMPEYSEVIAWMPIPDVYDGDLEENNEKMQWMCKI